MKDPKTLLGNYPRLEQLTTQELEDLLRQDFAAGESHSDPDLIPAILEVIAQRIPDETLPVDTDTAWASLRARTLDKPHDPIPTEEDPKVVPFPDPKPPAKNPPPKAGGPGGHGWWRQWCACWSACWPSRYRGRACWKPWSPGPAAPSPSCPRRRRRGTCHPPLPGRPRLLLPGGVCG